MSNVPTFRARSVNINEKIIIENEYNRIISESKSSNPVVRSVKTLGTRMEREEEEEIHVQEAISNHDTNIPIPQCKIVEDYESFGKKLKPFSYPRKYIEYNGQRPAVEYDLDDEDEEFLVTLNGDKSVLSEDKFEFMVDRFEKETETQEELPSFSHMERLFSAMPEEVLENVYNYWIKKRSENLNHPLTPFVLKPDPRDKSPYAAFRPRAVKSKKNVKLNNYATYEQLLQLRREMEKSRTLLEMIRKREKLKLDKVLLMKQMFDIQTAPAEPIVAMDISCPSESEVIMLDESSSNPVETDALETDHELSECDPPSPLKCQNEGEEKPEQEVIIIEDTTKPLSKRRAQRRRPNQNTERSGKSSKKPVYNSITLRGGKRIRDQPPDDKVSEDPNDTSLLIETNTSKKLKGMHNRKTNPSHREIVESR